MVSFEILAEVAELRLGLQASADDGGTLKMVRVGDLKGPIQWQDVKATSAPGADHPDHLLHDGDVLIARSGDGSVGNLAVVESPPERATFASYVIRVRPKSGWYGKYLTYWMKTQLGASQIDSRIIGTPISNLSIARLSTLTLPVGTYDTQVLIGDRLHNAYLVYFETRRKIDSALETLAAIRSYHHPSVLALWNSGYPRVPLTTITDNKDRLRVALKASDRAEQHGDVPYFGASGVIDHVAGHTHDGVHVLVSEDGNNLRTRRTPIAFVAEKRFWANNHVHVLAPDESRALPAYIALMLGTIDLEPYLTGSAQPKLNQKALALLEIPLPPLRVQEQVLLESEAIDAELNALRLTGRTASAALTEAWAQILNEAYGPSQPTPIRHLFADEAVEWLAKLKDMPFATANTAPEPEPEQVIRPVSQTGSSKRMQSIETIFQERSEASDPEGIEAEVDQFFEWLRDATSLGRVTVHIDGDQTYLEIEE